MITIQANPRDLERIMKKLQNLGSDAPKAVQTAVNDTAVSARKLLAQQAQKQYATISVQGRPLTQLRYHTTAPKSGVKTEVKKGDGLKELVNSAGNKAFKATGANANKIILQRRGKARDDLRSFHGPSVSKMIEKVYSGGQITDAALKDEISRLYQENLQKQIDKVVRM